MAFSGVTRVRFTAAPAGLEGLSASTSLPAGRALPPSRLGPLLLPSHPHWCQAGQDRVGTGSSRCGGARGGPTVHATAPGLPGQRQQAPRTAHTASGQIQAWGSSPNQLCSSALAPSSLPAQMEPHLPRKAREKTEKAVAMLAGGGGPARNCPPQRSRPVSLAQHPGLHTGPVHTHTSGPSTPPRLAWPPASRPPQQGPSTHGCPIPSLTAVHAKVALRADGLEEAVRPAAKAGGGGVSWGPVRAFSRPALSSVSPFVDQGGECGARA